MYKKELISRVRSRKRKEISNMDKQRLIVILYHIKKKSYYNILRQIIHEFSTIEYVVAMII